MPAIAIATAPVKSGNIAALGYDDATQTLQVDFHGGRQYQYAGVPRELYAELAVAASKGKFLHARIKPAFECVRVPDQQ